MFIFARSYFFLEKMIPPWGISMTSRTKMNENEMNMYRIEAIRLRIFEEN